MSTVSESETQTETKKPTKATKSTEPTNTSPIVERRGRVYSMQLLGFIKKAGGRFIKDTDGGVHIILGKRRIPINFDRDNHALARLMMKAANVSTLTQAAQIAIQRVIVAAEEKADNIRLKRFSAVSDDGRRIYVPAGDGNLLQITADGITPASNGDNVDRFWVEHPFDEPFVFTPGHPGAGLEQFERLLVNSQACREQDLRLLVAMQVGLFPYVRDTSPARMILAATGRSQQGKTTGQQRFTLLHGLGTVVGDYTVAALANEPDVGLLVLDNKEQMNLSPALIDYLLFVSTGARRGRSTADGRVRTSDSRPVVVVTTIEGLFRQELTNRTIEVTYEVGHGVANDEYARRGRIEGEIQQQRNRINSALMYVLQRYLRITAEHRPTPNPLPAFAENFEILCNLLRAYGEVAGKPPEWAERMIQSWARNLGRRDAEDEESEFEQPLRRLFEEAENNMLPLTLTEYNINYEGKAGKLLVTEATPLLTALQRLNLRGYTLPKTAEGLSRRLRSDRFSAFIVLFEDKAPELSQLKRTAQHRRIGFFFPDDEGDGK